MSDTFKHTIELGRPYLRQYLIDSGVELKKRGQIEFFSCIHPDHQDKNPSANLMRSSNNEEFHCFSCLCSGDVYTAAAFIEGKPLYGLGFVKENLEYILDKYAIEHSPIEFTEEQLSKFKYETVYNLAYELLVALDPDTGSFIHSDLTYAKERGWKESICKSIGIGSVKDFSVFINHLSKKSQLSVQNLIQMGIKEDLFSPEMLTFSIRDHFGKIAGFVSRNINWTKESSKPKYINTSMDENPFYKKDTLLFCLDKAKRAKDLRLDIYEGYGSAVTAQQEGYMNCAAIGGTALTDNHVRILREIGFKHINLVLDADSTGVEKMDRYIEKFSGHNGLEVTIMHLPFTLDDLAEYGKNDPDYYIRTYGIDAYRKCKPTNLFEHMLQKISAFQDKDPLALNFCKKMIPLVINEPDLIRRGQMVNSLAAHTLIDKEDIKDEIRRLEKADINKLKDDLTRQIRNANDPDSFQSIIGKALGSLEETSSTKKDRYLMSLGESIEVFDDIFSEIMELPEGTHGWVTGFSALDEILDGIPKPGKNGGRAIGFAGAAQHGKSAAMLNIALAVATKNKDVSVLYWAIDDHRKAIAYRLISMISQVPMRKILNTQKRTQEDIIAIREAQDILRSLVADRRLIFKDDRFGRSKHKAEAWIKETQDNTSNQILFCVDSMHNVQGSEGQETRVKLLTSSSWLKSLTARIPCTVMATLELVKNKQKGVRPTLQEISESGKMEFDFDTMAIVWHEAQGNYTDVSLVKAKWGSPGNWKPIIELDFQKNKAGAGEKATIYFRYDPVTTSFIDCAKSMSLMTSLGSGDFEMSGEHGTYLITEPSFRKEEDIIIPSDTGW